MKSRNFFRQFSQDPKGTAFGLFVVLLIWTVGVVAVTGLLFSLTERRGRALVPTPGETLPSIILEPTSGPLETYVTVQGEGWPANNTVLIFLQTPDEAEVPDYAIAGATVDETGQFVTGFSFPTERHWLDQTEATIIAKIEDGSIGAQADFLILKQIEDAASTSEPAPPLTETIEPTITSTMTVDPAPTPFLEEPSPTSTPEPPTPPSVTAITNLNIRTGPGIGYSILGLLPINQSAEVTGISADGGWWQIEIPGAVDKLGWVSASYVEVANVGSVPIVQAPPLAGTPTPLPSPTPTPEPYYPDWKAEYWSNRALSGNPVVVRNDGTIDFNWGYGSPASGLPVDNFSARWTRTWYVSEGVYRFHALMDDGVRLYVDNALVMSDWRAGGQREVTKDLWLWRGTHDLRVEYYEQSGVASITVWAEKISTDTREPEADFDADPRSGNVPLRVEFDNDSKGDYDDCKWYFGDDDTDNDCDDLDHTYYEAGQYTVKLKVWNSSQDDTEEKEDYITVRPVAEFSTDQRSGSRPFAVHFVNQSTNHNRSEWDFGDGYTSAEENPTHIYTAAGVYTVRLRVKEANVWSDTQIKMNYIVITEPLPAAGFTATPTTGTAPLGVQFTDQSTGVVTSWAWDFGDGTISAVQNPIHRYITAGSYTVRLTVNGPGGSDTETKASYITVKEPPVNQPPTAVINGPTKGLVGEVLTFNGGSSSDADGSIVRYAWDFGDGVTASGVNVSHDYNKVGSYNIVLTVTDDGGLSDTSTYTLLIEEAGANQPPVAMVSGPTSAVVGETVIFDSGSSHDPDGMLVSYVWDFGDSRELARPAKTGESTMAHVYSTAGTYQVSLTVTDDGGLSDTATHTIVVQEPASNQSPVAMINGPSSAMVGETVVFDSGSSHDPDGTLVSYVWDFGDSRELARPAKTGESTMAHVYSTAGTYQVSLTVTDDGGLSDTATHTIVVQEPASNQPPVAMINGPSSAMVGETVVFDSGSSHDPDGTLVSYVWDFGDSRELARPAGTGESTMAHVYSTAGTYQVSLIVTDDGGSSDTATHMIAIEALVPNQPPQAVINGPTKGLVGAMLPFDGSSSSDSDGVIVSYTWGFGDGATANGGNVSHSYSAAGTYDISLMVTDDEGLSDASTYTILIEEPPTPMPEPPPPAPAAPPPTPEPPPPTPEPPTPTPEPPTPTPEPPTPTPEPPTPTPEPPTPTPEPPTPTPEPPTPTPEPPTPTPEPPTPTPEPPTPTPEPPPPTLEPSASSQLLTVN